MRLCVHLCIKRLESIFLPLKIFQYSEPYCFKFIQGFTEAVKVWEFKERGKSMLARFRANFPGNVHLLTFGLFEK